MPGRSKVLFLKLKSFLKAQYGMKAELGLNVRWGGWFVLSTPFPSGIHKVTKF